MNLIFVGSAAASPAVSALDLVIFAGFFAVVLGLSFWKSRRRAGEDSSGFFLAGRGLTWPLIGISIVAANISTEQMVGMAGQAAGSVGLAVSCWQLLGSVFIVLIAFTLLPRFLRAGIYTMPEFLEYRYNAAARILMALLMVAIYALVMLPAVLFSGAITLRSIAGVDLVTATWIVGAIGAGYAAVGGLRAIAWADLVQGLALLAAGLAVFFLGLEAVGGWEAFTTANADKLHLVLPADNKELPWTGVVGGMWIVMIYYCGLNQFIVQRNLAAKSLAHGQLGMIFAGGLWLLVPFAIVMPGLMAGQLYADRLASSGDAAFPVMVTQLIGPGWRGFVYAAVAGAVTSTLASLLNSASTIFTMDIYRKVIPRGDDGVLVWLGRGLTVTFVVIGCLIAPMLQDEKFKGVFTFIQQFQGYIWPGVVAAFVMPFVLPRAPGSAGVAALLTGPLAYAAFQFTEKTKDRPGGWHEIHYLLQVLAAFGVVAFVMTAITLLRPLPEPKQLPDRIDIGPGATPPVVAAGLAVLAGVAGLFVWFW